MRKIQINLKWLNSYVCDEKTFLNVVDNGVTTKGNTGYRYFFCSLIEIENVRGKLKEAVDYFFDSRAGFVNENGLLGGLLLSESDRSNLVSELDVENMHQTVDLAFFIPRILKRSLLMIIPKDACPIFASHLCDFNNVTGEDVLAMIITPKFNVLKEGDPGWADEFHRSAIMIHTGASKHYVAGYHLEDLVIKEAEEVAE